MGKEKKKPKLGIKTSRYFTKDCKCGFEYPNWFTNCPKCGSAWDEEISTDIAEDDSIKRKNIKIVVKITEEDFDESINYVQLIFTADQGKTWFQMRMDIKMDYFIAEIAEVPIGSVIIYYIEVHLVSGEKVIENNDNQYFTYKVGAQLTEIEEKRPEPELETSLPKNIEPEPEKTVHPTLDSISDFNPEDNITIFGTPQTQIDPNLKVCPHCNSKIKKMWSVCPICGNNL